MALHLSITPSTNAGASRRATGTPGATDPAAAVTNVFANLLQQEAGKTAPLDPTVKAVVDGMTDMALEFGSEGDEKADNPDAIAAVIDAQVPIQVPFDTKAAFTDLVNGLADLKASLDAGEPLDKTQLQGLQTKLTDLAAALDVSLDTLPSLDDLQAMLTATLPDDTSVSAELTRALTPLAQTLLNGNATPPGTPPDQAELVQSLGEKLGALLVALDKKSVEPVALTALGFDAAAEPDTDLQAVLARFTAPAPTIDASPNAQVMGKASLEVTATDLTATKDSAAIADDQPTAERSAEKGGTTDTDGAVTPKSGSDADTPSDQDGKAKPDDKGKDARIVAAPAAADKPAEPTAVAQASVPAARADAVAAPRVVQAGYQTSQQQLNLPQLAFEVARQASDGNTRFQIRLDPAELGRIDVRLDIDASGQVNARLTVERAETLDLMQRDQRGLEKALQQAGLDGAKTSLEFSLKQNFGNGQQNGQDADARQALFATRAPQAEEAPLPTVNLYRGSLTASGVNIIA